MQRWTYPFPGPPAQSRNDTILPEPCFPDLPERLCLHPDMGALGVGGWECGGGKLPEGAYEDGHAGVEVPKESSMASPQGPVRLGRKDPLREESPGHQRRQANGTPLQGCGYAGGSGQPFGLPVIIHTCTRVHTHTHVYTHTVTCTIRKTASRNCPNMVLL